MNSWAIDRRSPHPLWANKKVLVICQRGNSRSVALAWLLKDFLRADALTAGAEATSADTMAMLCAWAETIIIVDKTLARGLDPQWRSKLMVWDVGADRYFRGFEPQLLAQYEDYLNDFSVRVIGASSRTQPI